MNPNAPENKEVASSGQTAGWGKNIFFASLGLAILVIAVTVAVTLTFFFRSAQGFFGFLPRIVQQDITREFIGYTESVQELHKLELARRQTSETVKQKQEVKLLGVTSWAEVEVSARVHYVYTVNLDSLDWDVQLRDTRLLVKAPRIELNRPAIDSNSIQARIVSTGLLISESNAIERLKESLSSELYLLGKGPSHLAAIRETCRKSLEGFLFRFLKHSKFAGAKVESVLVSFKDEGDAQADRKAAQSP